MRAGRKRKQNAKRVNGRISQRQADVIDRERETVADITATVRERRMREYGLSKEEAMRPEHGSVIGRLYREGTISRAQKDAAERYEAVHAAYMRAIDAPKPMGAQDLNRVAGKPVVDEIEQALFARHAIARFNAVREAVQEAQNHIRLGGSLNAALDHIVIRNQRFPHMEADLRLALNALQYHFGLADDGEPC